MRVDLVVAAVVGVFGVASLLNPTLYRKYLAPLCSLREEDLPPFPRAASIALLLFFGVAVLAPELFGKAASHFRVSREFVDWVIAIVFLFIGLGLLIAPRACLRILKWPQHESSVSSVITRFMGLLLLLGFALLTRSEILHR